MKKEKELLKKVGKRVRQKRKEKALTQELLGEKADINPKFLGKVERAETNVSLLTLAKICDALGTSLCELLAFTSMDKAILRQGELSNEIWKLVKDRDRKTLQLGIDAFRDILSGIEKLGRGKR